MGSSTWPTFDHQPLDGDRSWSATFDSYDQHHDDCYYLVRLFEGDRAVAELTVKISMDFAPGDNWETPEFLTELRSRIAEVAATGKTNTTYIAYAR